MAIPQPPDYVADPRARAAWSRLVANLQRRGQWETIFTPITACCAMQCSAYAELVELPGLADLREETRRTARALLVEMNYLPADRRALALLDEHGRDPDVLGVCAPLESAQTGTTASRPP